MIESNGDLNIALHPTVYNTVIYDKVVYILEGFISHIGRGDQKKIILMLLRLGLGSGCLP